MSGSGADLLLFAAEGALYCAPLAEVTRIVPLPQLTAVPAAPDYLQGVLNLAGRCLPVLDLPRRLGLPRTRPYDLSTLLLVCESGGEHGALAVDEVLGAIRAGAGEAQLAALFDGGLPAFRAAVRTDHGVALLLDLPRLLHLDLALSESELSIPEPLLEACRRAGEPGPP